MTMTILMYAMRGACGLVFVGAVGAALHLSFWVQTAGVCYVLWSGAVTSATIRDAMLKAREAGE